MLRHILIIIPAALVSLFSCAERPPAEPSVEPPEPRLVPAARVMSPEKERLLSPLARTQSALTNALCDRATSCNEVGDGERFSTRAECVTHFDAAGYDDLRLETCRTDVDEVLLAACLDTLKSVPCDLALESPHAIAACRAGELCPTESKE
jgi:hypothetical protein